jgi:hypothetical protein
VERKTTRSEEAVDVRLALPSQPSILNPRFPWAWGVVIDWHIAMTRAIPIDLEVEMSGGLGRLNVEHLRIGRLKLTCPGSAVELTTPAAAGHTAVEIHASAGMVVLRVPDGVAAMIDGTAGSIDVDADRFPLDAGHYRSPDYATATNRVDIRADVPSGALMVAGPAPPEA